VFILSKQGGSYERVHEEAGLESLKNKAKLILEYEENMSSSESEVEMWHPQYVHVLVPKHNNLNLQFSAASDRQTPEMDEEKMKISAIETSMGAIETSMGEIKAMLERVIDTQG
jgi:hypothetical protein